MLLFYEQHPDTAQIAAAAKENGDPIPEYIRHAPRLKPRYRTLYEAFRTLSTERSIGQGVGPIPWSACMRWCDRFRLDQDTTDAVWEVIRAVDAAWLKHVDDKVKAEHERHRQSQHRHTGRPHR